MLWIKRWKVLNAPRFRKNSKIENSWILVPGAGIAPLDFVLQYQWWKKNYYTLVNGLRKLVQKCTVFRPTSFGWMFADFGMRKLLRKTNKILGNILWTWRFWRPWEILEWLPDPNPSIVVGMSERCIKDIQEFSNRGDPEHYRGDRARHEGKTVRYLTYFMYWAGRRKNSAVVCRLE